MTSEPPEPRSVFRVVIEGDAASRADLELIRPLLEKFRLRITEKPVRGKAAGFFTHQLSLLYDIADDVEKLYPDFEDREKKYLQLLIIFGLMTLTALKQATRAVVA